MTRESIYIMAILMLIAAIVLLVAEVLVQKNEIKELLGRRDKKDKPKQQAEDNHCSRQCALYCTLEENVIPELQSEIEYWKQEFKKEQRCNALMHQEIAKLRTGKENNNET